MTEIVRPPELWGVWSETNEDAVVWFAEKAEAVEHAKNTVAENFGVKVHLFKATSVGTIEVPAVPVATGEMSIAKAGSGNPV